MNDLAPPPNSLTELSTISSSGYEISAALEDAFKGAFTSRQAMVIKAAHALVQQKSRITPDVAAKRARLMVGCYRAKDFVDVEVYLTALIANLCEFPECVVNMVTDPRHGIPAKKTFCPAVAEVIEECRNAENRIKWGEVAVRKLPQ